MTTLKQSGGAAAKTQSDFENLVNLLSVLTEADNRMKELESDFNREYLAMIDDKKEEYAKLQKILTDTEQALEIIARMHRGWFEKKKTVKTPFGEVSLKDNPARIVSENEEVSIALIQARGKSDPEFNAKLFLRETVELNLDTIASLTDAQLEEFQMKRVKSDTFKVVPLSVDLGKAVQERAADKKEAA